MQRKAGGQLLGMLTEETTPTLNKLTDWLEHFKDHWVGNVAGPELIYPELS